VRKETGVGSVLPRDVYVSGPAGGYRVGVIGAALRGNVAILVDLDELELNGLPSRHRDVDEPSRVVWVEHRADGAVPPQMRWTSDS
jgi:hypothetical protein